MALLIEVRAAEERTCRGRGAGGQHRNCDILRAGDSPPFIQVGMVLRPTGAAAAMIPSAGDGGFNDGPRTVVAVEKPFGEPAYAKMIPGYQNSETLQERCDWLRKYWVLVNDFRTRKRSHARD